MNIRLASTIPFAAISSLVLIPCSAAISERVSPDSTTTSVLLEICEVVLRVCLVIRADSPIISMFVFPNWVWGSG